MANQTDNRQATDAEVIAWAVEAAGADEDLCVESFCDIKATYSQAVEASYEDGTEHLIQQVGLWIIAGGDGVVDGMLLTVDLPSNVRLASLALDYHDLIPSATPEDAASLYPVLLANVLAEARRLVAKYEEAR